MNGFDEVDIAQGVKFPLGLVKTYLAVFLEAMEYPECATALWNIPSTFLHSLLSSQRQG